GLKAASSGRLRAIEGSSAAVRLPDSRLRFWGLRRSPGETGAIARRAAPLATVLASPARLQNAGLIPVPIQTSLANAAARYQLEAAVAQEPRTLLQRNPALAGIE